MPTVSPLKDLEVIEKTSLSNNQGIAYMDFHKNLSPRYLRIFFDIALGYALLFLSALLPLLAWRRYPQAVLPFVLLSGLSIGYWIAYLQLFIHEAAHFNIAPGKKLNDLLSDLFIGSWAGQHTASYREIHWDHHRFLGQPNDTEHNYFDPLNLRFFLVSLTGIKALRILLFREGRLQARKLAGGKIMFLVGTVLNGSIVAGLWLLKCQPFAIAWVIGFFFFFPFFVAIRQLLEHRDEAVGAKTDYFKVPHGKTTRMFKEGLLGSSLGGGGFTRHLLHHWDPQVSYTRLAEVEAFLMGTRLKEGLAAAKTTYLKTFFKLFRI